MILFICPQPAAANERHGLGQRVSAVDGRFSDVSRIIADVSFTQHFKAIFRDRPKKLRVLSCNAFLHLWSLVKLARHADAIYVHTCHYALRVLWLYAIYKNVITDMHGALPEEIAMQGKWFAALRYAAVERYVVRRSKALIAVTEAMARHFEDKYGDACPPIFVIPVFPNLPDCAAEKDATSVIYAGSVESWQCIDDMLIAIRGCSAQLSYTLLSGAAEELAKRAAAFAVEKPVHIASVASVELPAYYARASFGFVLRDDHVVNRVACPTKLVEYLHYGVVPILKSERIGDFHAHNLNYIRLSDFIAGKFPSRESIVSMRRDNQKVLRMLREKGDREIARLRILMSATHATDATP